MKRVNLVINVVLVIAIGVLFVLHFTDRGEPDTEKMGEKSVVDSGMLEKGEIAYVNIDTLMNNMDMYYDLMNKLSEKQKSSEAELSSRSKDFENAATDFQEKVSKGLVTRSRAREMESELQQEQQELIDLKDQLSRELSEEQQVTNRQLLYYIKDYLMEYNKQKNYIYIVSNSFGGPFLYATDKHDITEEVIVGINAKYAKEQK